MSKHIFMRYPNGLRKALTLSYDDGPFEDIRMIELLDKHKIKCTFNINSGRFSGDDEVCKKYIDGGHEIAVHTVTHPRLDIMPSASIIQEVLNDRIALEQKFGTVVRGMAYPYGYYSDRAVEILEQCGIVYSRTTHATGGFDIPSDWLRLPATCHHNNPRLMELADKFIKSDCIFPELFYLWGHTHEFESNRNWNIIEEFAAFMGNRDDIWYAANIEVYDYVRAYEALQFSADESLVHNPSALSVWLQIGKGEPIEIASGKTVKLN